MRNKIINIATIICSLTAIVLSIFSIITINKIENARKYTPSNLVSIREKSTGDTEFRIYDEYGKLVETYTKSKENN